MNRSRRAAIQSVIRRAEAINLSEVLDALVEELERIRDEEQEALDSLPQSIADGERGQAMTDAIDALGEAIYALGEIPDVMLAQVEEANEALATAQV